MNFVSGPKHQRLVLPSEYDPLRLRSGIPCFQLPIAHTESKHTTTEGKFARRRDYFEDDNKFVETSDDGIARYSGQLYICKQKGTAQSSSSTEEV